MTVGFIGLGNLGAPLAGSILRGGFPLAVHDLDADGVSVACQGDQSGGQAGMGDGVGHELRRQQLGGGRVLWKQCHWFGSAQRYQRPSVRRRCLLHI